MGSFIASSNWKINNMKDWIKCNVWSFSIFGIIPIVVGLAVGLGMSMNDVMTPLFIVPWVILVQAFNLLIVFLIQRMINLYWKKGKILLCSSLLYVAKYILFIIPLIIIVLVHFLVSDNIFNIWMTVSLYAYFAIVNLIVEIIYSKYFYKKSK